MTTKFYEFLHVSEMVETVFGLSVLLLFVAEVFVLRGELWTEIATIKQHNGEDQEKWFEREVIRRGINTTAETTDAAENSMVRNVHQDKQSISELNPDHEVEGGGDMAQMAPAPVNQPVQLQVPIQKPTQLRQSIDQYQGLTDIKRRYLQIYEQINELFNKHIPVIMCCMVLAIMTESTFIMSAICFFCYVFFNLVFNYAKLVEKLEMKIQNKAIPLILQLMANCFIVVFFIGILIRTEFLL